MPRTVRHHVWTLSEVATLREMLARGVSLLHTARTLRLTSWTLRVKCRQLGIDLHERKTTAGGKCSSSRFAGVDRLTARCECGILLPCWTCVPKIGDLAGGGPR